MNRNDLINSVLKKLNPYYDMMNVFLTFIALAFTLYFSLLAFNPFYMIGTICSSLVGIALFLLRKRVDIKIKIRITLFVFLVFFIYSFVNNGFIGSGVFAFAIFVLMTISFFDFRKSIVINAIAYIAFLSISILINSGIIESKYHIKTLAEYKLEWYRQSFTAVVYIIISYVIIGVIKEHLIKTLVKNEQAQDVLEKQKNELIFQQENLKKIAYYDQLTGIHNRHYITDVLSKKDFSASEKVIVAILDIVNFKLINANYGMHEGDVFLKYIADTIKSRLPDNGDLVRIGSNEFAVILPNIKLEEFKIFSRLCYQDLESMKSIIAVLPKQPYIVSYFEWDPKINTLEEVLDYCSIAITHGKDQHHYGLIVYEDFMNEKVNRQAELLSTIALSIENDEFQVWFQGKFSISQNRIVGYEALSRWLSSKGEFISPGEFIPLINNSLHMKVFNEYIIKKSIKDFEVIQVNHPEQLSLSLNISPLFFILSDFTDFICQTLDDSSLKKEQVILEITEDVFIDDYLPITEKIETLSNQGFKISLDDFGSGYSSLSHINSIQMDEIKIDRSIIIKAEESKKSLLLIELVIEMAKRLNIKAIAEGVESASQVKLLNDLGIDLIQGYYYSKPQPKEKII